MPKFGDYTASTAPNQGDLLLIKDINTNSTKKITRSNLLVGTALPNNTVTTDAITNSSVTTDKLAMVPAVKAYLTASLNIGSATESLVTWTNESYDTTAMHSTSVNPSRVTIGTTGIYAVKVKIGWTNSSGGNVRVISLFKNGTRVDYFRGGIFANEVSGSQATQDYSLTAGDYLEVKAYQNSGAPMDVIGGTGEEASYFSVSWIGKSS